MVTTATTTTIDAASAIADAASAAHFSAADATCRHPRASTAGRWTPPPPIATGVVSTITTDALTVMSIAAITAVRPPAAP